MVNASCDGIRMVETFIAIRKVRVKYTLPVDFYLQGSGDKFSERPEKPQGSRDGILVVGYGATQK